MSFKKNKYQVIRQAISKDVADIAFTYLQISAEADFWMLQNNETHSKNPLIGKFTSQQVPNCYSKYADRLMETLLIYTMPVMQKKTKLNLIPTYAYTRLYRTGNVLRRHKDRPSCEISTTLNLGGDPWSIYLDPTGADNVIDEHKNIHKPNAPKGIKIDLKPGDMLIYSGCDLEHWREPFQGKLCGQVFLHYNYIEGKYGKENLYDKRPILGIPELR